MRSLSRCATTASVAAAASIESTKTTPRPRSGVICSHIERAQNQTLSSSTHKPRGKRSQSHTLKQHHTA
jgi:hypothetical protein